MQYHFILNEVAGKEKLTIFLGGVPTQVDDTHPAFNEIVDGLGTLDAQDIRTLLDSDKRMRRALAQFGNVTVDDGTVTYKGDVVHGQLATRMVDMLERGIDIRPWALFLENLQKNPAKHAVDELYLWLERSGMPITERGNFLAYKKVQDDYTSYHRNADGTEMRNDIGTMCEMPRNKVCDNRNQTCSQGLHFCSWDYLPSYMGNRGKVIILEINPAHVVSIPNDYNNAKGRGEAYLVVGEIPEDQARHAFPGSSYADFSDSAYLTHEYQEDTDFSSVDDGWFVDIWDKDMAGDEPEEEAYQAGQAAGFSAGFGDDYSDPDGALSLFGFNHTHEDCAFLDGYADGYHDGCNQLESEYHVTQVNTMESFFDIDDLTIQTFEPVDVDGEYLAGRTFWTLKAIAQAIVYGDVTMESFITNYNPDYEDLLEVISRLREAGWYD